MVLFFRRPVKGGRECTVCGDGPPHPQASAWCRSAGWRQQAGWLWVVAQEGEGEGVGRWIVKGSGDRLRVARLRDDGIRYNEPP
jgi:hypothetical protein